MEERLKPGDYGYGDGYWNVVIQTDVGALFSFTIHGKTEARKLVGDAFAHGLWGETESGENFYPAVHLVSASVKKEESDATAEATTTESL